MKTARYDIFRKDLLGTPVWMEAVDNIETAKVRMMELADRSPGEYFVFRQESQEIVSNTAPRLSPLTVKFRSSPESISTHSRIVRYRQTSPARNARTFFNPAAIHRPFLA
jgi:hypothetical protein